MGKNKDRNKEDIPNPASVANRDILQRLNFLYQASVFLNGLAPPLPIPDDDVPIPSTTPSDGATGACREPCQKKKRRRVVSFEELSRSYIETMKNVGKKTNVRMDPSVKRRICKRCSAPLVPGISAAVRIQESTSHGHVVSYRCHGCHTERRIPAPPVLRVDSLTNEDTMHIQSAEGHSLSTVTAASPTGRGRIKRKKAGPQPRLPPHFARDVGHVVFRGSERLDTTLNISQPLQNVISDLIPPF